jgi:hypothetical protein
MPPIRSSSLLAAVLACLALTAHAQDARGARRPNVAQSSTHIGEMAMPAEAPAAREVRDRLRFEPSQQIVDIFTRGDHVFLMRPGPTDWSRLDAPDVAPTDCANQRVMSPEGRDNTADLDSILASNGIVPARILVSEWCRNQQTVESMLEGMSSMDLAMAGPCRPKPRPTSTCGYRYKVRRTSRRCASASRPGKATSNAKAQC